MANFRLVTFYEAPNCWDILETDEETVDHKGKQTMMITAVYYCEDSGPYKMIVVDVCDRKEPKTTLWKIFEEEIEKQQLPTPSSDVVFLYTKKIKDSNVVAQMLNEND